MTMAKNPIFPGFYPDPSICAVGEDYYIVNSSFCYFPGLPVMHSKDLAHWEQLGNILTRKSQLSLKGDEISRGLFAPTMRYHNGIYYVICTNVDRGGNFIVKSTDPSGPWSDPFYLNGADGIDPSLFFDPSGKCYYIGTHENPEGARYNGDWYIYIQEIDLTEMKLVGEHKNVWNGALKNVIWPEGPHLYYENGYYYIMHAEGGTGPEHAVTVCRSRNIWGPYENNPCNPILTHRHFGQNFPVRYVGHGDLMQTVKGEWYMVLLAVRQTEGYTTMGRETFLAKVTWENDWPVVNAGHGMLTDTVEIELPEWKPSKTQIDVNIREYTFGQMQTLGDEFLFLRDEEAMRYELTEQGLDLFYSPYTMSDDDTETYLALRQQHKNFTISATLPVPNLSNNKQCGVVYLQNNQYHLRIELAESEDKSSLEAKAIMCKAGVDEILAVTPINQGVLELTLSLKVQGLYADAVLCCDGVEQIVAAKVSIRNLSTEVAGGFVGCTTGVYAVWKDMPSQLRESCTITQLSYRADV